MSGPYALSTGSPPQKLITAQSALSTQGVLYCRGEVARVTVVVQGDGTLSSGVLTIEEAFFDQERGDLQYSGTWSSITTVNATDVTGGQQKVIHIAGSVWALRVRISTVLGGGGTMTVWTYGN